MFDIRRARKLNNHKDQEGSVLYWMSRDMRVEDNWAMILAAQLATQKNSKLVVVFTLVPEYLEATWRQYEFMLKGLLEVEISLQELGIEFIFLTCADPVAAIVEFVKANNLGTLVTDFSPLRMGRKWRDSIATQIGIPMIEVDAHNVVPVWVTSPKQEFAARTIRPKITKLLSEFLVDIPRLRDVYNPDLCLGEVGKSNLFMKGSKSQTLGDLVLFANDGEIPNRVRNDVTTQTLRVTPSDNVSRSQARLYHLPSKEVFFEQNKIQQILDSPKEFLKINFDVLPSVEFKPGYNASQLVFNNFCHKFEKYDSKRNDPNANALSDLSPYYHFGQISTQRVALDLIVRFGAENENVMAYLEEMIVRRELSDNFCFYQENYDNYEGLANWAKLTLTKHWSDERDFVYNIDQWENSKTHDPLWNAANNEMKQTGKMHGFMRMYWAKKILEWSANPAESIRIAIYLNDKYSLDGRDPNGYVGVLWSIGGLHDRAWFERPVYGQIRYMNYNGCKNKFDVKAYEQKWTKSSSALI